MMTSNSSFFTGMTLIVLGISLSACVSSLADRDAAAQESSLVQANPKVTHAVLQQTKIPANRYREAPLPAGFAEPDYLMQPRLQSVPAHRAVEGGSFSQCFRHIKRNNIPMTAPVYMTMDSDGGAVPQAMKHMRFVFPHAQVESPMVVPGARVVDVPEKEVLVMYVQGVLGDERMKNVLKQMRDFLSEQYPDLYIASDVQILGYNSPFVLPWKKLWAIQFEVKSRHDKHAVLRL